MSSADYALNVIFSQFENAADAKMSHILNLGVDNEIDLRSLLGQGADESFDKVIYSLSSLAATQQSAVIDAVMRWRKAKVEPLDPSVIKRVSESAPLSRTRQIQSVLKERQSLASVFILCRALIEIIRKLTPGSLPDDLGENLEEIVFNQLKKADPEAIKRSKNRTASMDLFAELIGELSNVRFASVSDRFIAELENCAGFFKNAHGAKVKHAYADLFIQLLLPAAEVADAEVNFPAWAKAVDLMYPRALKMILKPRHISVGYPLITTLLCVSRKNFFAENWTAILESCYQKFSKQDKYTKCKESTSVTYKKLDTIIKTLFPPFRRAVHPSDIPLDHFILIVYFSLMRDVESGTKKILYYLLSIDTTSTGTPHTLENICSERMIIALSAFKLMLSDLEKNTQLPPFPSDTDMTACGISISCTADVFSGPIRAVKPDVMSKVEEAISKTLIVLDQTFGRLLLLDEKNIILRPPTSANTTTSTTTTNYTVPIFTNSGGPSESGPQIHHQYSTFLVSYTKDKQPYFDVIKSIIDCMPRLMPAGVTLPRLIEMLSRYTVHTDPEVIKSASKALLRIAEQIDSQTTVTVFSRYICKIEDKFLDVVQSLATGPINGTGQDEHGGIIKLYLDLLSIWISQLETNILEKSSDEAMKEYIDSNVWKVMDFLQETEANGLLFLCSQSTIIRKLAIQMLKVTAGVSAKMKEIVNEHVAAGDDILDSMGQESMYSMLDSVGQEILQFDKDSGTLFGSRISTEIRNRILHYQRKGQSQVIAQIAESDNMSDLKVWNICYPEVIKKCFQHFSQTIAQCRIGICGRILQIHPSILAWMETMKASATGTLSMSKSSNSNQKTVSPEIVEQWRIYLIFACITATPTEETPTSTPRWSSVGRKGSSNADKASSPRDLFRLILPCLTSEHRQIRESAIEALGHINSKVYKTLIYELDGYVRIILEDGKQRNNQKPYQNKRSKKNDRLRISVLNVLELTADCLSQYELVSDKNVTNVLTSCIKETKSFLADTEAQIEWEYQRLRVYLCRLVEKLYNNIMQLEDPTTVMSFETRLSLYKMFEEWCGYGVAAKTAQQREATMMRDVLEQYKETKERASMMQLMNEERKLLELASLSAMATLCRGPLYAYLGQKKARQAIIQFDTLNVLKWIDAIFESQDPKYHSIARQALEAVMIYNQDQAVLLDDIIEQCYAGNPKLEFTQGYFQALAEIITKFENYPYHIHQIMSLALFKTGDAKKAIRKTAIQLLRVIEERVFADSCAKEYEIGITSSLPAIYKHTQTLLSARLALDHPEQTYSMLSEITQRFEHISSSSQREVLTYMLPWHRKLDLSVNTDDTELSASAYMVLSNLYFITIKFGDVYVKEIAALWSQLVDNGRNVRAIIMYLLDMGQEKRNPWFLIHAKRVFVFLGRTHAFNSVIEEVISEITPRSMVPQVKDVSSRHVHAFPFLFVADTEKVLPSYPKKPTFARGQLAMSFLVDLAIEAGADLAPHLPLFLHNIFVQLDHLTSIICDQSRCFLMNLIHSIVIRQSADPEASRKAYDIIQWLSSKEGKRLWVYENITPTNRRIASALELKQLLQQVVEVFSYEDHDLRQKWGETALKWATCCSVRHIACRSFQCFRALMPAFNQHMLADMLARLSNTIADKSEEIRGFALEIIITLTEVANAMDEEQIKQFPQLFWAAVACLYSPYESEHGEALLLLEIVLDKYNDISMLVDSFPKDWSTEFDGLQPLLLKGLQFSSVEEKTFVILNSISLQDNLPLIDPSETRLMYLLLGCIPRLLHGLETENAVDPAAVELAEKLVILFEGYGLPDAQRILMTYPNQKSKFQEDYLKQILGSIRDVFLTKYSTQALIFSLLLVKNKIPFYRDKGLLLIENLLPYVKEESRTNDEAGIDIVALEPLLQLISTEYADRALHILNSGIPTVTGERSTIADGEFAWGFNNFAVASKMTRENIHAVVFECSSITNEVPVEHDIQFSVEDFSMLTGESNITTENAHIFKEELMLGVGGARHTGNQYGEDLMNALKDLDDFFNEEGEPHSPSSTSFFEGSGIQQDPLIDSNRYYQ
ncbi:hypothetical protein G6F69_004186 [Rhizopus microsporus]|nr:hypothetical protein G6F69_004186 [Rhizopus microsporus]